MKIGSMPLASIVLMVFALTSFITKHFFTAAYPSVSPYIHGAFVGAMLVFILYYANIYGTAWLRNRREAASADNNTLQQ